MIEKSPRRRRGYIEHPSNLIQSLAQTIHQDLWMLKTVLAIKLVCQSSFVQFICSGLIKVVTVSVCAVGRD